MQFPLWTSVPEMASQCPANRYDGIDVRRLRMQLASHDNPAVGEGDLSMHLRGEVPPRTVQGRVDVLGADVSLGEVFLVGH